MKTIPAILLGILFAVLMLTACVHQKGAYPAAWATIDPNRADRLCPDISGLYAEMGEVTEACHPHQEKCHYLSYSLLGGNIGYTEVWDDNPTPAASNSTTHVELRQQDDQTIDVILWLSGVENGESTIRGRIVGQQRLTVDEGDFSCSEEGLRLKSRSIYYLIGVANMIGFENRTLNRTEDRDLVMKSQERLIAHYFYAAFGADATIWVRWQSVGDGSQ